MQKLAYLVVLPVMVFILQAHITKAKLTVMPKTHSVSACVGDTVSLEVEIGESEGPVSVTWKHGSNPLDDHDHFALSEEGRKLTVLDILPPHSGLYHASVEDVKSNIGVVFTVDVKDIFMRLLVKNPLSIPPGKTDILRVSKSDDGVLWWVHGGRPVQTIGQHSHYRFLDTKGATGSVLEIYDAQREQAGMYEVILKSGSCEIRNLIQVNVGEAKTDTTQEQSSILQTLSNHSAAIAGTIVPLFLVLLGVSSLVLYARSRKHESKEERKEKKSNTTSDNPVEGITLQDPIYSIVEERAVYGKGNIYDDDPHDMGAYETDQYGSQIELLLKTTP